MRKLVLVMSIAIALCSCKTESKSQFSSATVDVGIVVKNAEESVAFYRDVIGMTQKNIVTVPKLAVGDAGLADYKTAKIYFMTLDASKKATTVKIMSFTGKHEKQNQKYVDSTYGISYLTIFVKDADALVARLKEQNIKILNKGPVSLKPLGFAPNFLIVIKDPDGNFIELIGPMK